MNTEEHIQQHKDLHTSLDELLADFIGHTERNLSNTTLMEFLEWSHSQTVNPSEDKDGND